MILADTSVWIDHLRQGDAAMRQALEAGEVLTHPFVIGEIALGQLPRRAQTLAMLALMPSAPVATPNEWLSFVERHRLFARGVGYVDVHLLASAALGEHTLLWTRDRRLVDAAVMLGLLHVSRSS